MNAEQGRADGLDGHVARLVRGRHVTVAAAVTLSLTLFVVARYWEVSTDRERVAGLVLATVQLLLARFGSSLERPFLRAASARWSPVAVALAWLALAPLAYHSLRLAQLGCLAAPFTCCWLVARGWSAAHAIVFAWFFVAVALQAPALALLPAAALLLRRRPAVAFGAVLGLGALLRLLLSVAAPRPLWEPDSGGYATLAYQVLSDAPDLGGQFARPPYVSALLLGSLSLGRSHFAYVLAAHAVGFLVGWWASASLRRRLGDLAGWQACAALVLFPELMFYEHTVLSEATFLAFLTVLSVKLLDLRRDATPSVVDAVGLGLATGLVASARPVALLAPIVVLVAAAAVRWQWRRLSALAAGCAAPVLLVCATNLAINGFFGVSSPEFRAYVWFSVTGHTVVLDAPLHAEIKREMRPAIERHNQRHPPWDPETNDLIWAQDGPISSSRTLQSMPLDQQRAVLEELAREAILHDPLGFATRAAYQLFVRYLLAPRYWNDSYVFSWEDVRAYDRTHEVLPRARADLLASPVLVRPFEGEGLYRPLYFVLLVLTSGVGNPAYGPELFSVYKEPWVLLALLVFTWWRFPRLRVAALTLIALGAMMIVITCVVQEPIPRYRLQVYPIGVVLVAVALARRPGALRGVGTKGW